MANKVIRTSCNLSDTNNCYTSDKASSIALTMFGVGGILTTQKTLAITFVTNHTSKGVLIPVLDLGGPGADYNDWNITIELQRNIAGTWTTQGDIHTFTPSQIIQKTNSASGGAYLIDCEWKTGGVATPIAVTTPTNTWRLRVGQTGGITQFANWYWAGTNSTTGLSYCEYTTTQASYVSGDDIWMTGVNTVNINTNTTLGNIIHGTGITFNPFSTDNITITQSGTKYWHQFSNIYSNNGSLVSPRIGCFWNCGTTIVKTTPGVNFTSKYAFSFYGAIPTKERCEISAPVLIGETSFTTTEDVSSWTSGQRFFFSIRDVMGVSSDPTLYTLDGDPTLSSGTYTVNFLPALDIEDVICSSLFKSKACLVDGYGITFEGTDFYFALDVCPMKREFSGVSFIMTPSGGAPGLSYASTYSSGDLSDVGGTTSDHCSFVGSIASYPITEYGWGVTNSHLLGSNLDYGIRQTSLPGILNSITDNVYLNNSYVSQICGAGSTVKNFELANIFSSFLIDYAGVDYSNWKIYGVDDGNAGSLAPYNSLIKVNNLSIGGCFSAIGNNGTTNIGCVYTNVNTENNLQNYIYGALVQTVIKNTNEGYGSYIDNNGLDRNFWLRFIDYIVDGDFLSVSRNGYFVCQSDTKMTVKTTQIKYDNPADYRISTGTIANSKVYISLNSQIQNALYYSSVYTLPSLSVIYDITNSINDNALANTDLQLLECEFTPTIDNQEMTITINQKTDVGEPDGDVVWSDFVLNVRKYGYIFQSYIKNLQFTTGEIFQSIANVVVNTFITETDEVIVAGYTGIAIDYTAKTCTITATRTIKELYDYSQYDLTLNMSKYEWFTTIDGTNFIIDNSWALILDFDITGSQILSGNIVLKNPGVITNNFNNATLDFQTAGTYNFTNANLTGTLTFETSNNSTCIIEINGGVSYVNNSPLYITIQEPQVYQSVIISGATAGSEIQLYDLTNSVSLYVGKPTFPYTWTDSIPYVADRDIRLRVAYCSGLSAKKFIDSPIGTATYSSPNIPYLVNQEDDVPYIQIGLDGSTVSGIVIDDSHLLIKFTAGVPVGGVIKVDARHIYSYNVYWLSTSAGIIDEGRIIEALDSANFTFYNFKIRNETGYPIVIINGYCKDAITGESSDLIDFSSPNTINFAPDHIVSYASGGGSSILTEIKDLLEADEEHTPTTIKKKHKTTKAVILSKNITGSNLINNILITE